MGFRVSITGLKACVAGLGIAALAACGGAPSNQGKAGMISLKDPAVCYFPRISPPEVAPGWVCEKPHAGLAIQAFGVVEPSTDIGVDLRRAEHRARTALSSAFVSDIVGEWREFYEGTGVRQEAVNAVAKAVSETLTKQTLRGVGRQANASDRDRRVYVLVGIPLQEHGSNIRSSVDGVNSTVKKVRTTRGDDDAEYQLWRAQEAFDDLRKRREGK